MLWQLRYNEMAELIASAERIGEVLHPKITRVEIDKEVYSLYEPPLVATEELFYLKAFWDLDTEREVGWSFGPIPYSRIRDYGIQHGLAPDVLELFIFVIRRMDQRFVPVKVEQMRQEAETRK